MTPLFNSSHVIFPSSFASICLKMSFHFSISYAFSFWFNSSSLLISSINYFFLSCLLFPEISLNLLTNYSLLSILKERYRSLASQSSYTEISRLKFSVYSSSFLFFASKFSWNSGFYLTKSSTVIYPLFSKSNDSKIFLMFFWVNNFFLSKAATKYC